ncbi:MAG: hypothetical protein ACSLEX_00275 [Minisyncoccota bacterium]
MLFLQNKKNQKKYIGLFFAVFIVSHVALLTPRVYAVDYTTGGLMVNAAKSVFGGLGSVAGGAVGLASDVIIHPLLYLLFQFCGFLVSVAVTIFGWVINPDYISGPDGFLNLPIIYTLWQFVRDFFNIAFIFVLLFIAFTTVFQVQKDFKKALLSLVLTALFVNFSYPVTRALIDTTNVPMYFLINQLLIDPSNPGESFGTALQATRLDDILLTGGAWSSDTSKLFAATIFLFIFAITLLVLAIMHVIRLVAFVVLLVFSSVGFAASMIPGLKAYSDMWWKNFWKYALFGPASMFMLLVATRFFAIIADPTQPPFSGIQNVAQGAASDPSNASMIAAMAMFSIPIIMLWMAIGLGHKFGMMGADSVSGKGEKFVKWAGKKTFYDNPLGRGFGGAMKKVGMEGKIAGRDYGSTRLGKFATGNYWNTPSTTEATIKGGIVGGKKGVVTERKKIHVQQVRDMVAKHKKDQTSYSQLVADLKSPDKIKSQAAALTLAQNDDIRSTAELSAGLKALDGDIDLTNEFVKKGQSAIQSVNDLAIALSALGNDSKTAGTLIDKVSGGAFGMNSADYANLTQSPLFRGNPNLQKQLDSRLKKEGHIQTLVDHQAKQPGGSYNEAYANLVADMTPEELAKQKDTLHNNSNFFKYVKQHSANNDVFSAEHRKNIFAELSGKKRSIWVKNDLQP